MSDKTTLAKRLFEQWKVELKKKDAAARKWSAVESNFEEIFYTLHTHEVDYDIAEALISEIAAAHMPNLIVVDRVWKAAHQRSPDLNKREWLDHWKESIKEKAMAAFFTWYQPVKVQPVQAPTGSMDAQEYARQRRYADRFAAITSDELRALEEKRQRFLEGEDDLNDILANI